jgi:protein translocase SEC61 complex gamma subunit
MPISDFFNSASRLLRTLNRPDWKTYSLSIKIVFAGIGIIGAIGYIIRLVSVTFST